MHESLATLRSEMHEGLAAGRGRTDDGLAELRCEMHAQIGSLRADMAAMRADLIRWMFVFWVGTVLTICGLLLSVVNLLR
jgi:hypothetical protein